LDRKNLIANIVARIVLGASASQFSLIAAHWLFGLRALRAHDPYAIEAALSFVKRGLRRC
jgi:hypothetical protein